MFEIEKEVENVFIYVFSLESLEEIVDEENSSEIFLNKGGLVVEEVIVFFSLESLDEIGDYIEIDFFFRVSRYMFVFSLDYFLIFSDEDEGYGVNQERDLYNKEKKLFLS